MEVWKVYGGIHEIMDWQGTEYHSHLLPTRYQLHMYIISNTGEALQLDWGWSKRVRMSIPPHGLLVLFETKVDR